MRFLGRELPQQVLLYQCRVKAVLWSNAQGIDGDGLLLTLCLDDRHSDHECHQDAGS